MAEIRRKVGAECDARDIEAVFETKSKYFYDLFFDSISFRLLSLNPQIYMYLYINTIQ